MEFYSASGARPTRLQEKTRAFAERSLKGQYGDDAMQHFAIPIDDIENFESLSPTDQYDLALRRVCEQAPVRICPEETVSGSANLGLGIDHRMPVTANGKVVLGSVSHLTMGFDRAVREGIDSYERRIKESMQKPGRSPEQLRFLQSLQNVIDCMHIYHARYFAELKRLGHPVAAYFEKVPFAPPSSFREAIQSLWFCFAFARLSGNWPGIGRIDQILGPYLKKDLQEGAITLDEAREMLAGFFIKGCEWILSTSNHFKGGDAQHYQNLILGGLDENGEDSVNEVSYLVIDVVEELPIGDFPITVRLSDKTPAEFKRRLAETIRHGGGVIAFYNERLILNSLTSFGYDPKEALRYGNDGCWEVQVPGATCFIYNTLDALRLLLDTTLRLGEETPRHFDSFEEVKQAYLQDVFEHGKQFTLKNCVEWRVKQQEDGSWKWNASTASLPVSVISLFEDDCIEKAEAYYSGGARYTAVSPHLGGVPDAANSLYAIKKLVFDEKKVSFDELMRLLQNNWEGGELLQTYADNRLVYYGNDSDEPDGADDLAAQILRRFSAAAMEIDKIAPIRTPPGVSTFGRQVDWAPFRKATPAGKKAGEVLAGNLSPTPGTDIEGATAVIRSYAKAPLADLPCGAALDLKLLPSTVQGENGITALISLMDGFCLAGGFFVQMDVADAAILRDAQAHPEKYKALSVRVSGWNARFITLDDKWQEMIINRTEQGKL